MTQNEPRREVVPGITGGAVWQSEKAKSYRCPICHMWIFSQYEGEDLPTVTCKGFDG